MPCVRMCVSVGQTLGWSVVYVYVCILASLSGLADRVRPLKSHPQQRTTEREREKKTHL